MNTARGPAIHAETLTPGHNTSRNFSYNLIPEQKEFQQQNMPLLTTLRGFDNESQRTTRSPVLLTQSDMIAQAQIKSRFAAFMKKKDTKKLKFLIKDLEPKSEARANVLKEGALKKTEKEEFKYLKRRNLQVINDNPKNQISTMAPSIGINDKQCNIDMDDDYSLHQENIPTHPHDTNQSGFQIHITQSNLDFKKDAPATCMPVHRNVLNTIGIPN